MSVLSSSIFFCNDGSWLADLVTCLAETFIFYDQPEFDVFWQMAVDLDVPVYLHPRVNPPPISTLLYAHAPFLIGAPQEFAVTLSTHILGLCTNGVFE